MRLEATPLTYRSVRLCGCSAGLAKRGVTTRLGRYVEAKVPKAAAKLKRVLAQAARRAIAAYRAKVKKADEDIVRAILAEIDPLGLSEDLAAAITPDMVEAYKVGGIAGALDILDGPSPRLTDQIDEKAIGWAAERGGELIKQLNETTVDDLRSFLSEAVAAGMGPEDLADAVDELGAFGEARSIMIARTELAFAHVQGNLQGWRETGQVEGKRSILGDTHEIVDECDDAVEAGVVPIDQEIIPGYDGPPYHPNACFGGTSFAAYGELRQVVRAHYDGPAVRLVVELPSPLEESVLRDAAQAGDGLDGDAGLQQGQGSLDLGFCDLAGLAAAVVARRVGFAIGPNHPMLTLRGWVKAAALIEGDYLVHDSRADAALARAGEADLKQVMSFEDVFESLKAVSGRTLVAAAARYFHGDEAFTYGEVEAVRPARELLPVLDPRGVEQFSKDNLVGADVLALLEALCGAGNPAFQRGLLPRACSMGGSDDLGTPVGGETGPPRFHLCRVVSTHKDRFRGYAFDASTGSGVYSNNGFVVKNCLCDIVPVLTAEED